MSKLHAQRSEGRLSVDWANIAQNRTESLLGVLCDTPGKRCFDSKSAAQKHIDNDLAKPAEPYQCHCGSWHVRTKMVGKARRGIRR